MINPAPATDQFPRPPLRVGILVNSLEVRHWVWRVLADIRASSLAEIVLVIQNSDREPGALHEIWAYRRQLLPLLYDRLDALLTHSKRQPDAFARRSAVEL